MLAYVFWHAPAPGGDRAAYEDALWSFHAALRDDPPEGFLRSTALRVTGAPWLPGGAGYEDWYLVGGFAGLGALNEAAVSGHRRRPHDDVARRSGHGAGGVYALWTGAPEVPAPAATWCTKASGSSYEALRSGLSGTTWQRQLVLGPAPELCVGGGPVPAGADVVVTTAAAPLWPPEAVTPPA